MDFLSSINATGVCVTGVLDVSTCVDTEYIGNTTVAMRAVASSYTQLYYNGTTGGVKLCTVTNGICLGTYCGFGVDWVGTSDCRLKTDIKPISNALSMVTQLEGVYYRFCDDKDCELRIGLVAQDVEKVIPEMVSHSIPSEDDACYGITDDKLGLKYDKLTAVLIEAIKEQQLKITELENEINKIKNR